jgi:hypothetical protein
VRPDDQPRPELDTAVDAVASALTAVDDEMVAASLRRTRVALAERRDERAGLGAWRWGLAAAAAIVVLAAALLWQRAAPPAGQLAATPAPSAPVIATGPAIAAPAPIEPAEPARIASAAPAPRTAARPRERVHETSAPAAEATRRGDPLAELVRAVQAIPEDAWTRGGAAPDVTITPIAITPLEVPAIPDAPAEPIAPGEP